MEKAIYTKLCPSCSTEIQYKTKYALNASVHKNSKCVKCRGKGIKKNYKPGRLSVFQKDFWIKKGMTEEDAVKKVASIQSKASSKKSKESRSRIANETSPYKIETWTKKGFSKEQAEFEVKSRRKCNVEYWTKRGMSKEESLRRVSEFQSSSSKNPKGEDVLPTQLKYWLKKGFSQEEAEKKLKDRQATFTLEKCILKWGEEEGRKKWIARQKKWKEKVYGENGAIGSSYSNLNKIVADFLKKYFPSIRYFENKEWFIWDDSINKVHMYDICYPENKKIVEINGDFWHMNPIIYDKDFINPSTKLRAEDKWKLDKLKRDAAIRKGYSILTIWESDLKTNKEQTLNKCLEFLQNAH